MDWKQLLVSITRSVDQELQLRNEYLASENRLLRNQIKGHVQLSDGDRQALAESGQKLGKQALGEIATIAKLETILAWYRKFVTRKGDGLKRRKALGRPRVDQELGALVVRMARENRSWGYDRIMGALHNLGYTISDQTVGNILKRQGIPSAPERKKTVMWREFIDIHMAVLGVTNFFSSELWTWYRMQRHASAPAHSQSRADTGWTSTTSTSARQAANGRQPRSRLRCDWLGTGEVRHGREVLY